MRNVIVLGLLVLFSASCWAQDKVFDWVRASDEFAQLYPADYHAGRVYRAGDDGGNMHVNIEAKQPVTIAMAFSKEWNEAQEHPETISDLEFRCIREHVVNTTYECHLPPNHPMVLLVPTSARRIGRFTRESMQCWVRERGSWSRLMIFGSHI